MLRYFILEILVPILIFTLLRSILRSLFQTKRTVTRTSPQSSPPPVVTGGELRKDPVCGTYVSTGASVTRKVDGELVHFCSTECRDKYRAA
jgi:YHS domain-containing protein